MGGGNSKSEFGVSGGGQTAAAGGAGAAAQVEAMKPTGEHQGDDAANQFMVLGQTHYPAVPPPSESHRQQCLCETGILDSVSLPPHLISGLAHVP